MTPAEKSPPRSDKIRSNRSGTLSARLSFFFRRRQ
jgi:hypothetical protein